MLQVGLSGSRIKQLQKRRHPFDIKFAHVTIIKQAIFMTLIKGFALRFFITELQGIGGILNQ